MLFHNILLRWINILLDTPIFYVLFSLSEYVTGLKIEFHNRDYEKKTISQIK